MICETQGARSVLTTLLREQEDALRFYFAALDLLKVEEIASYLLRCRGTLLFSGVGKSGHIAQKMSATFLSIGIKAFFLDPLQAMHGDLGSVSPEDLLLAFSKSGESQELLALIPYVRKKGAKVLAIVSSTGSRLAKLADDSIALPVQKELCPFDLTPTISTATQLLFGDVLAVYLMRQKKFTLKEFALNHPGGWIGRRISVVVADLMLKGADVPLCRPTDRLIDALHQLSAKRCGCLLVTDEEQQLLGIFTDGDLRRALAAQGAAALEASLQELMTLSPRWIEPHLLAIDGMRQMEENPNQLISALPVLEGRKVVGLLRLHDILQAGL